MAGMTFELLTMRPDSAKCSSSRSCLRSNVVPTLRDVPTNIHFPALPRSGESRMAHEYIKDDIPMGYQSHVSLPLQSQGTAHVLRALDSTRIRQTEHKGENCF
jgi:hypothetical protein